MTARAISSLTSNGVEINKEMWMKEAIDSEKGQLARKKKCSLVKTSVFS